MTVQELDSTRQFIGTIIDPEGGSNQEFLQWIFPEDVTPDEGMIACTAEVVELKSGAIRVRKNHMPVKIYASLSTSVRSWRIVASVEPFDQNPYFEVLLHKGKSNKGMFYRALCTQIQRKAGDHATRLAEMADKRADRAVARR